MTFLFFFLFILITNCFFLLSPALAQCPVCVITIGGGMLIAKKLGIDDLLVSIWISALNTAISFWLATKFKQKFLSNPWLLSIIMFVIAIFYFQFTEQIGHSGNRLLGIDKIIFGQIIGLITMFIGNYLYSYAKYKNNHQAIFPYSKIIIPTTFVLLVTLIFKFAFSL